MIPAPTTPISPDRRGTFVIADPRDACPITVKVERPDDVINDVLADADKNVGTSGKPKPLPLLNTISMYTQEMQVS